MRPLADAARLQELMREFGRVATHDTAVFFAGGATAVLLGWRASTVDADLRILPDANELLGAIPEIKERLRLSVELAAPSDFIPELPGWRERSVFIGREGAVSFFHYDLYSQALAKIERGHANDLADVAQMIDRGFVARTQLVELYAAIEPQLFKYPAIDPGTFRAAVRRITA